MLKVVLQSPVSLLHCVAGLGALLTGTLVVCWPKGTARHRWLGRAYAVAMTVLLTTAFQIYHTFGRFGLVHAGAVASALLLAGGIGSVVFRYLARTFVRWHYHFMTALVVGLYTVFQVESTYRLFPVGWF
jgi:uncharacterized membrane protein